MAVVVGKLVEDDEAGGPAKHDEGLVLARVGLTEYATSDLNGAGHV
jgi:hypothetical protein